MAGAVKIGPWGASGGKPCDISSQSKPQRLVSITVNSTEVAMGVINGFSFVYADQKGQPINVGPWGKPIPGLDKTIKIAPGEHLNHVSGTADGNGITSLKLTTNQAVYGPYGWEAGGAFSMPLQQGKGEVVAFYGRSGDTLKALGVFVPVKEGSPVKVGPWGGSSGAPRDINLRNQPVQLESFTVYSTAERIYGFSFTYGDQNGQSIRVGLWGKTNRLQPQTFSMNEGEYVNCITGTTDDYGVTSLKLTTNQDVYGPFGCSFNSTDSAFSVPLPDNSTGVNPNGAVVAFFGRSGNSLVAIGTYVGLEPN